MYTKFLIKRIKNENSQRDLPKTIIMHTELKATHGILHNATARSFIIQIENEINGKKYGMTLNKIAGVLTKVSFN